MTARWLIGCLALCALASTARADDPLRLVPAEVDFVFAVPRPRRVADTVMALEALDRLRKLDAAQEYYASTNFRKLTGIIELYEKKFGVPALDLLDKLAGDGVAVGLTFGDPPPALLVLQGRDADLTRKFVETTLDLLEGEIARTEGKDKVQRAAYRDIPAAAVGDKLSVAAVGSALLVASTDKALKAGIDLHLDGDAKSVVKAKPFADGKKLLPAEPLAWLWLNFEKARDNPQFKVGFDTFTGDPTFALALGGFADVSRRSPFLVAGLTKEPDGFALSVRFPRGKDGMGERALLVLPPAGEGSLPPLEPTGVQSSLSYFLDLGKAWDHREQVLNKDGLKGLADLEKASGVVLGSTKLSGLLHQTGPHQRFVYAQPVPSTVYKTTPKQPFGAFAVVQEIRDPAFAKSMNFILRSAGLVGAFQFGLKMVEEDRDGVQLVSYRFSETKPLPNDPDGNRFNFSPCFALVGDQFLAASTVEIGREMVGLLKKEGATKAISPATGQMRFFATGLAASLKAREDELVTKAVLGQALTPAAAKAQTADLIRLVERLGTVRVESTYGPSDATISVRLTQPAKAKDQ